MVYLFTLLLKFKGERKFVKRGRVPFPPLNEALPGLYLMPRGMERDYTLHNQVVYIQ